MTNINIDYLENTKTADGITEYAVPRGHDGEITLYIAFPDSVEALEKYIQIQSHNERKILKFPGESSVAVELNHNFNYETKITIDPQAGYDDPVKYERITIVRE